MTCATCGTENKDGRKFCSRCGAGLALACTACGAANDRDDAFCGECGAPLAADVPAEAPRGQSVAPPVAERRLVSVLFADLVGFTTISEARDAESVRELLSRYFETCRRLVELYGGTVEKFIGDAVMAVWGAPVAQEDDAERAVRTALDLVAAVSALGDELGVDRLRARAGVTTGEAAVTLGAKGEGMVAGDLVNTSARIQAAADPGSVLVGDVTRRATEAAVAYEPAGTRDLKGKAEPVPLFRALRVTSGRAGAMRSAGLEPPFVGRERELRLVKELFHASAEQRRAQFVSVVGIAGIGKSRLGWEFFKYIDGLADTVYWHRGRCLPYGDGVAYWALAEMVRGRAGIADGEDVTRARVLLADSLAGHVPDPDERAWVEPRLANLLGLEERTDTHRPDLFAAWRVFFERLSDQYPVVLVFEDMQWGDAALLAFVEHLLEWSAARPIFVLVLARPELFDRAPDFGRAVRNAATIALEPLPERAMRTLLEGFAPGLPNELQRSILDRAQGVPLYAVETVRMLLDRRLLAQDGAVYRPTGPITTLEVPETLHALVAARLDGLDPAERRLVQDASVLGKTFAREALAAVSAFPAGPADELLAGLVRKEVLSFRADPRSPERGQYGFLQDLVRQVAYETLARRDRKARHLAAAQLLRESVDAGDVEVPEVLASHYLAAYEAAPDDGDAADLRRLAAEALSLAGERAAALAAPEEGQRHFERAAEITDDSVARAQYLERAGTLALRANVPERARSHLERSIAAYGDAGEERLAARASAGLADVDVVEGRLDEAVARLDRAVELPLERGERTPELAAALAQLARALTLRGDAARAAPVVEQALRIAEAFALDRVFIDALNTKGIGLVSQNRLREALILLEAALTEARRAGHAGGVVACCEQPRIRLRGGRPCARIRGAPR
jgi:class 3 adenylate cyclase/tetratricopeptide (TPR) repeat protein